MTDQLKILIIEVSKSDSSFVYFTLEANEGLCFYSTLKHEEGDITRKIEISYTKSLENEFLTVFKYLKEKLPITIISIGSEGIDEKYFK